MLVYPVIHLSFHYRKADAGSGDDKTQNHPPNSEQWQGYRFHFAAVANQLICFILLVHIHTISLIVLKQFIKCFNRVRLQNIPTCHVEVCLSTAISEVCESVLSLSHSLLTHIVFTHNSLLPFVGNVLLHIDVAQYMVGLHVMWFCYVSAALVT